MAKEMHSRFILPLDMLQKASRLPDGHVDKKKAEAAVNREYSEAQKQELKFAKRLPRAFRSTISNELAKEIVSTLCSLIGTKEPKLVFNSKKVHLLAIAHCSWKEIHFKGWFTLTTVIHELTHHVNMQERSSTGHGERFLWTEQFLFDLFMDEILSAWKLKEQGLT